MRVSLAIFGLGVAFALPGCMGATTAARTTPEILALEARRAWPAWPGGCEPKRCPVFVRNELVIPAPPERVYAWLERADLWPTWYARVTKVHFDHDGPALAVNDVVDWHMLGARIRVTVRRVERGRLLEWEGGASGVHAYHTWLLEPVAGGTLVLTEETEHGPVPSLLSAYLRHALKDAHQAWLESLARIVAKGDPPPRR